MKRYIEVWYTNLEKRDYIDAENMFEARKHCKALSKKGYININVDVFFKDKSGDLIESKSIWYSYENNKLKKI